MISFNCSFPFSRFSVMPIVLSYFSLLPYSVSCSRSLFSLFPLLLTTKSEKLLPLVPIAPARKPVTFPPSFAFHLAFFHCNYSRHFFHGCQIGEADIRIGENGAWLICQRSFFPHLFPSWALRARGKPSTSSASVLVPDPLYASPAILLSSAVPASSLCLVRYCWYYE